MHFKCIRMIFKINPKFTSQTAALLQIIKNFNDFGTYLNEPVRNAIKIFDLDTHKINVKSFKKPNFINAIIYGYFRKSKAQRSYEYANILLENNIGTPQPIAFLEKKSILGLKESYYISEQLEVDLLFRGLTTDENYPNRELILRQFTRFTFQLHEKGIEFIDNTSGNTLIKKISEDKYEFYLVDLNRMNFHDSLSFDKRIKNIAKLTSNASIVQIISEEYANISKYNYDDFYTALVVEAQKFQDRFYKKRALKRKLKFWKKS